MGYEIEQVGDEPIFIITYQSPVDWATDGPAVGRQVVEMSRDIDGLHIGIHDVREVDLTFQDILAAAPRIFDRKEDFVQEYSWIIGVGTSQDLKLGVEAARRGFTTAPIELCLTMEEALARAREILKEQGGKD